MTFDMMKAHPVRTETQPVYGRGYRKIRCVEAMCMPEVEGDRHKDKVSGRAATGQVTEGC